MEMNDKRKKQLWIGGTVLAVLYFGPAIVGHIVAGFTPQPTAAAVHAKPSAAIPMPVVSTSPAAQFAAMSGKYSGDGLVKTRLCKMELELNSPDPQGQYTAYSALSCFPDAALTGVVPKGENVVSQFRPAGAILSGSVEGGAIKLKASKSIETLADGCTISGLSIVGFGAGRVAVDWDENACPGGQIVLIKK